MGLRKILLVMVIAVFMAAGSAWAGNTVDINTATAKELQKVEGIGVKASAKIVAYRNENGPFKNVKGLLRVKGIGKKTLEKAMAKLSVGNAANDKADK